MKVFVRVRWGDCDPAGIAFYPRFFEWMDVCSDELHRLLGIKRTGAGDLRGLPLVEVQAEFLSPAFVEDELEIRAWVTAVGRTSLSLRYEFVRLADGVTLARTRERRVHVERAGGKMRPAALTDAMRQALDAHKIDEVVEPAP